MRLDIFFLLMIMFGMTGYALRLYDLPIFFAHGHQYECDYGVHHHEVNCIDSQGIYKTFTVSE